MAVGMAIAERHLNAIYGDDLVDHRTFVIAGDGCLMEGVNHEAVGLAGHLKLGRLIVLWDDNRITIDGSTDLSRSEDVVARHAACGWHTVECDGLDAGKVVQGDRRGGRRRAAVADPLQDDHRLWRAQQAGHRRDPRRGARRGRSRGGAQGAGLGPAAVRQFPTTSLAAWREVGQRGGAERAPNGTGGSRRAARSDEFLARMAGKVDDDWLKPYLDKLIADPPKVATRKASEMALEAINAGDPGDDRRLGRPDRLEQHQDQGAASR